MRAAPCSSRVIVGNAVETMVWSSAARLSTSISIAKVSRSACGSGSGVARVGFMAPVSAAASSLYSAFIETYTCTK